MSAGPLRALFEVDSGHKDGIVSPPTALRRDEYAGSRAPSAYELQYLASNRHTLAETPRPSVPQTPTGTQTPAEYDGDLEMSRPSSPMREPTEIVGSLTNPPMNKWRYAAACAIFFASGMNDSSTGAIIPYMEAHYDITYGIVSMIFVTNAVGFVLAATYSNRLQSLLGLARHYVIAEAFLLLGYAIIVTTPAFWAVCLAFFFTGTGMALVLPPISVFVCNLTNSTTLLGILHGVYGIGGVCGPLIATSMVSSGIKWSHYYGLFVGISAINLAANFWANRDYEKDVPSLVSASARQTNAYQDSPRNDSAEDDTHDVDGAPTGRGAWTPTRPEAANPVTARPAHPSWREILSRTTCLGASFILFYQGAEVSISGWVLSFLLAYRAPPFTTSSTPTGPSGYDPLAPGATMSTGSLGYVTSGFWAGLTLSRMLATERLAHALGEVWSVACLAGAAGLFQLLVWLVPSLIAESVAIAILGAILGPIYPLSTVVFARYLDRRVQTSSLAVVVAMGSSGGAIAPFLVGIVSQAAGVWVLHPICLGLYAGMGACWLGLNWGRTKRRD